MAIGKTGKSIVEIYFNGIKQEGILDVAVTASSDGVPIVTVTKHLMRNDRIVFGTEIHDYPDQSGRNQAAD